ncbi:heparinase II/III domain-containing protein [Pseudonocardia sp. TRM90224]|uniref:heparinase II/III domain-containing protein n=1 Tax=Pseudonocardia sp. TRM90224 TaxID=2812678 RepID=UPI001E4DBBB0|nr:heparinase II/III family protein [Pseudonocardia sp. TRM90224]
MQARSHDVADGHALRGGALVAAWRDRAPAATSALFPEEWGDVPSRISESLTDAVEADRAAGWPPALLRDYAAYPRRGERVPYEDVVRSRLGRIARATALAAIRPATGAIDDVADGTWLVAEQSTWCWPAHDDAFERTAGVVPALDRPYLDLGAAETAATLAVAALVLGDQLDAAYPGLLDRVTTEVRHRVLDPFRTRRDWHWLGLEGNVHNWNPWIHGNLVVTALAFDRPDQQAETLGMCVEGIDRYLAALPADGGIDEGGDYWWHGACRALEALDVLDRVHRIGLFDLVAVDELLSFPHRMQISAHWNLSFADAEPRPRGEAPWFRLRRWGERRGLADVVAHATAQATAAPVPFDSGAARLLDALLDPAPIRLPDPSLPPPTPPPLPLPLPLTVELRSIGLAAARECAGSSEGLFVSIKAGHNGQNHNHLDLGAIEIAVDGVPVVVDAGRPTYDGRTFTARRYELWPMRSEWHSTLRPRGLDQEPGERWAAPIDGGDDGTRADWHVDLSRAYPLAAGELLTRQVMMDRTNATVTVHDRWRLDGEQATSAVLILHGEVAIEPGELLVRPPGAGRGLRISHDADRIEVTERALDDPYLVSAWGPRLTRVELVVESRRSDLVLHSRAAS